MRREEKPSKIKKEEGGVEGGAIKVRKEKGVVAIRVGKEKE
jgi:hypothetical protein